MAVPASIRAVERPSNTIIEDNGRDGPNRYAFLCFFILEVFHDSCL